MTQFDVVLCPTSKSLTHTDSRRAASAKGVRVATLPGVTEEVMVRCMNADYHGDRRAHVPHLRPHADDEDDPRDGAGRHRHHDARSRGARPTPVRACSARRGCGATCRRARRTWRRSKGGRTAWSSSTGRWPRVGMVDEPIRIVGQGRLRHRHHRRRVGAAARSRCSSRTARTAGRWPSSASAPTTRPS